MRAIQRLMWMSKRADGLGGGLTGGLNRVKPEFSPTNFKARLNPPPPQAKPFPLSPQQNQIKTEKALERQPNMGPSLTPKAMPEPKGYVPNIDPKHQELFDMHKKEMSEWANARTLPQLFNTSAKAYMRNMVTNNAMDWSSFVKNQENLHTAQNAGVIPKNYSNSHPAALFNDLVKKHYSQRDEYLNNRPLDANSDQAIRSLRSANYFPESTHEYLQPQGRETNQMHELNALWQKGIKARKAPLTPDEQRQWAGR